MAPGNEIYDSDESGESIEGCDSEFDKEVVVCLFCEETACNVDFAIKHLKDVHDINLSALKGKFHMDFYSYIKFINYIRQEKVAATTLVSAEEPIWDNEKYLKPVEYEPWLSYVSVIPRKFKQVQITNRLPNNLEINLQSDFEGLKSEETEITVETNARRMEETIEQLMRKIKKKDELLEQAAKDMEKLRKDFRLLLEKDSDVKENSEHCISNVPLKVDEGYFSSYAHFSVHHIMLSDTVRTLSYRDALLNNSDILEDKVVLDVGCGTSILSMFACQAGARKVIAVDNSEIIFNAMDISRKNNFSRIEFMKGRLEDTNLSIDKFDVIVSEWMGYFLIFEGMLDTIIYARERHLKPGGIIIPNRCSISLVGYGDMCRFKEYITFWDSVYGFDMSSMKAEVLQEPLIEVCKPEFVLTEPNIIADYDLNDVDLNYSNFSYNFNLKVIRDGKLTSFVGYFDTFFDLPHKVFFSTSPNDRPTHWKQVVFFIKNPIELQKDSIVSGSIICQRNTKDLRSLKVKIKVFNKEFCYHLD